LLLDDQNFGSCSQTEQPVGLHLATDSHPEPSVVQIYPLNSVPTYTDKLRFKLLKDYLLFQSSHFGNVMLDTGLS
jgi:hypothetical protein